MKPIFLFLLLILFSCRDSGKTWVYMKSGFIKETGTYIILSEKQKRIIVKECTDGTVLFAITDQRAKVLYQQNLNQALSKYHYWNLYVDSKANVWWYDSDFDTTEAFLYNNATNEYELKDYCTTKLSLPEEFKKEMKTKNALENCKSMNR